MGVPRSPVLAAYEQFSGSLTPVLPLGRTPQLGHAVGAKSKDPWASSRSLSTASSDGSLNSASDVYDSPDSHRRALSPIKLPVPQVYTYDFLEDLRLPMLSSLRSPPRLPPGLPEPAGWSSEAWAVVQARVATAAATAAANAAANAAASNAGQLGWRCCPDGCCCLSCRSSAGLPVARGCEEPWPLPVEQAVEQPKQPWQHPARRQGRGETFTGKFVFTGYDLDRDASFELVPRVIGRGGSNIRPISNACNGRLRVRGHGSGHMEYDEDTELFGEAKEPLHIAVTCLSQESLLEGMRLLEALLRGIRRHFGRYCRKQMITPVPELYTVELLSDCF
eukprot:gb/GFBE01035593.1/.p1 GENE.gb/GFBE01035593.1/~~gb/GFBE01035593.1/.p1  ORF type:complete len:335 (+),score=61.12 gb/GFBE01035593.1/:1-1005(+)